MSAPALAVAFYDHSRELYGSARSGATVLFEAPGRVAATLGDLAIACGVDRPAAICRELTKLHEEVVRGGLGVVAELARDGELTLRGEFAIVVGEWRGATRGDGDPGSPGDAAAEAVAAAREEVEQLVEAGMSRGAAAKHVAAATGIPRRRLYEAPDR